MSVYPLPKKAPTLSLSICSKSAQVQGDNDLPSCGRGVAFYERTNTRTGATESKSVHLSCGKRSCPRCSRRKRAKLLQRVAHIKWRGSTRLWTFTTDPKTIDPDTAIATINRRWHLMHREIIRRYRHFRYLKVLELTKSGLPHLHVVTDTWIEYFWLRSMAQKFMFGQHVNFQRADSHRATAYAVKYVNKAAYHNVALPQWPRKPYSTSLFMLPVIRYVDPDGNWYLVAVILPSSNWRREHYWSGAP